jgi:transposase-like protein
MSVKACPECDTANPYQRRPSVQGFDHTHRYRCEACDHRFDTPKTREPQSQDCIPGHSLAAKLDAMDADEVGP